MLIDVNNKRVNFITVAVNDRKLIVNSGMYNELHVEFGSHFEAMKMMQDLVSVRDAADKTGNWYFIFNMPSPEFFRACWCSGIPLKEETEKSDSAPDQTMDDLKMELKELH